MNRKELVAAVADQADLEQKTVDAVLRSLQSTLEDAAAKGEKVSVPGFFALSVGRREAREGQGEPRQLDQEQATTHGDCLPNDPM